MSRLPRADDSVPDNWLKAFIRLDREINDRERTVVLLDEASWLGHYDETFADLVKIAWDDYWSVIYNRAFLCDLCVLCG